MNIAPQLVQDVSVSSPNEYRQSNNFEASKQVTPSNAYKQFSSQDGPECQVRWSQDESGSGQRQRQRQPPEVDPAGMRRVASDAFNRGSKRPIVEGHDRQACLGRRSQRPRQGVRVEQVG